MDFETINFDLGIFSTEELSGKSVTNIASEVDIRKETIDCKEETEHRRFAVSVSESDIQQLINSQANPNTRKNTKWSTDTFNKWRESRKNVPYLKEMNADSLSYWLQRFVLEVRKLDGSEYPPRTLYYIVCGLLRHLRDENIHNMNFLDENDLRFAVFRKVLDARMKELLSKGLGTKVRQADPILPKDEEKIWDERVFRLHSSQALQYTVFFYNCKVIGLRAFDEHRNLECAQFEIGQDDHGQFIRFSGRSSKTFKGGLQHLQLTNKDIKHYCDEGERCLVDYYRIYLDALGNEGPFYRRPLAGSGSVSVRYGEQVLGINKLKGLMKEITGKAELQGNFTNHSGKRTCATQLYHAGVDEQEIMQRTGHRSETAVRKYKRTNSALQGHVSEISNPPTSKKVKCETTESENCENTGNENIDPSASVSACEYPIVPNLMKPGQVYNNCVFNFKP
ncbi:hypothetical protein FSP39_022395 [Pinctada imbricata]|uniref:DUF3504 domain-containing protein n=1 Tax=Pinctada imbricata TaxID=66713 RepID=A0AA88YUG6_PINIB|nr:hypothetical protein FSP39_022395 [Pinctada imbricata]